MRRNVSNNHTGQNENFRENGALRAGGNDINANADEINEKFGESPMEG